MLGGPEVVRVVLNSSSTGSPPHPRRLVFSWNGFCPLIRLAARRADTQRTPRLTGSWSRSPRASARLQGSVRSTVEWDVSHPPQQQKWRLSLATGHIQIGPIRYEDRHYQIF